MMKPLTEPITAPSAHAPNSARGMSPPQRSVAITTTYSTTCAIAVNDTSGVPPRISTNSTPTAKMPLTDDVLRKLSTFSRVRKDGLAAVMETHSTRMSAAR